MLVAIIALFMVGDDLQVTIVAEDVRWDARIPTTARVARAQGPRLHNGMGSAQKKNYVNG
jgi:hypothetical protein